MKLTALPLIALLVQTPGLQVPAFSPPTRTPAANSPADVVTLRAGIALYEQGKYDEAIAKFDEVLKGSPDNAMALYELALSSVAKKDYYMPFIAEMQQKKLVEPFVYYVSQRTNLPGVREWLTVNRERVLELLAWAKQYQFPKGA
jgi:tetratricopeptide (TPR) repeat protein